VRVWVVRSLRAEGYEQLAFDGGFVAVGWSPVGDLAARIHRWQIRDAVKAAYPFVETESADSYAEQLYLFRTEMARGDLVLLPRRSSPDVAAGWVTGDYQYRADLMADVRHIRAVRWARVDLPRATVERELLSLSPLLMVLRIDEEDTVHRLRDMVDSGGLAVPVDEVPVWRDVPEESEPFTNLRRNLDYARRLATAGQHLARLKVGAFEVSDVFRAAWVQGVAALDHWVRQEVRTRMLRLVRQPGDNKPKAFAMFAIPLGQVEQLLQRRVSLEEVVDKQLTQARGHLAYQHPDKIRDAFQLVSDVRELWQKVAKVLSERAAEAVAVSGQDVQDRLIQIVRRRNKIAHESDVDPDNSTARQPIDVASVTQAIDWIEQLAAAILDVLDSPE
jgi:hypothetical protein